MAKFAVFDIDGTLIRWQLYHAMVDGLARHQLLDAKLYKIVLDSRMAWKRRESPESFKTYEQAVIKAYESALPKMTVAQFNRIIDETADQYKEQVYRYTRQLAVDLKRQGYVLLAISGSHQELVEHICDQYGFDDCVGTQYLRSKGRFTGQQIYAAANKQKVLDGLIAKHDLTLKGSYAVGDSKSDAGILAMVDNPIAFNPDRELFDIAQKSSWPIVVERKNVIYQLAATSGRYQLQ